MPEQTFLDAIRLGLAEEMRRDDAIYVFGEDVALGGPFGVTKGLAEEFGVNRMVNTPISEGTVMGLAIGDGRFAGSPNLSLAFLFRAWHWPEGTDWIYLLAVGISVSTGGLLISQAYRLGEAALIAPFEYASMPMAVFWGVVMFGLWPDLTALTGIALTYAFDYEMMITGQEITSSKPAVWTRVYGDGVAQAADTWSGLQRVVQAEAGTVTFQAPSLDFVDTYRANFTELPTWQGGQTRTYRTWLHATNLFTAGPFAWHTPLPSDHDVAQGLAVAHARVENCPHLKVVVARPSAPIDWDAADGQPVQFVLLVIGSHAQDALYLQILSEIIKIWAREATRALLLSAQSSEELARVIAETRVRSHPR